MILKFGNRWPSRSRERLSEAQDRAGWELIMEASPATSCGCWAQTAKAEPERQGHYLATCYPSQARAGSRAPWTQRRVQLETLGGPLVESQSLSKRKVATGKEVI